MREGGEVVHDDNAAVPINHRIIHMRAADLRGAAWIMAN